MAEPNIALPAEDDDSDRPKRLSSLVTGLCNTIGITLPDQIENFETNLGNLAPKGR